MVSEKVYTKAKMLTPLPDLFGMGHQVGKYFVDSEYSCTCGKENCEHSVAVKILKGEKVEMAKEMPTVMVDGNDRWTVVSAWHKSMRRGDVKMASHWLEVLIQSGIPSSYLNNYITSIVGEELCLCDGNTNAILRINALNRGSVLDEYNLYAMVEIFCEAKKWHFCDKCSERRERWVRLHRNIKARENVPEIPSWVYDKHTRKGKALDAEGKADNRWAGTWLGMKWRRRVVEAGLDPVTAQWDDVDMSDSRMLEYIDEVW